MSELPKGWERIFIGDVMKPISGGTPPSKDETNFSKEGGVAWLTPADLSGYRSIYIARGARNLSEKGYAASSATKMPAGSVLFSSRAPVGYVAIAANEIATNQGFKSFSPPEGINSGFLYYYLRHIKPIAEQMATGTTFKELSGTAASKLPLLVAPYPEQKRIADKLDNVLARINVCRDRLDRVPTLLKRFRQAVLVAATSGKLTESWRKSNPTKISAAILEASIHSAHDAVGGHKVGNAAPPSEDVHNLSEEMFPEKWSLLNLRDVVDPGRPITYGILKPGPELATGVPYIRVADFPGDKLNISSIRKTSTAMDETFKRSRLRPGDLLLSIRGTVGRMVEIPPELNGANITQDSARLSIQKSVSSSYILWYLRSPLAQDRMKGSTKGVAVRGINIGDVRALQVPIPSREEQNEIVRRVEILFNYANNLEARYSIARKKIEQLTPATLAKAFRGELVPQNPGDEAASSLLKRLADRKAELSAQPRIHRRIQRSPKNEVNMSKLDKAAQDYLTTILRTSEDHQLDAKALWQLSSLPIQDFYEQLKLELDRGFLKEIKQQDKSLLEAI